MSKFRQSRFLRLIGRNPRRYSMQAFVFLVFTLSVFSLAYFVVPVLFTARYSESAISSAAIPVPLKKEIVASHRQTPTPVKAIYMTSCVVATPSIRNGLVKLIEETELNSVVIDVKDFTGRLSFVPEEPALKDAVSTRCFAPDMRQFVESLHQKGIYVIGRITVFQDPHLVKARPELAVKRKSDGGIWKDYKGLNFTDPGSREVWDYTVSIGKESYGIGFDELNFDYVRFPSDGNMSDIAYPWSGNRLKAAVLKDFFAYLRQNLKPTIPSTSSQPSPKATAGTAGQAPVLSVDLFGMTTTNTDDLNIGQVLENALPYFDYVAPMVYPSHYPTRFMGFANPADKPYEVVRFSMDAAVRRALATSTVVALDGVAPLSSTTPPLYPKESFSQFKLRPWLQDFNLGAVYTAAMVDKQIQATYDAGLDSWMLWNAANKYTKEALLPE